MWDDTSENNPLPRISACYVNLHRYYFIITVLSYAGIVLHAREYTEISVSVWTFYSPDIGCLWCVRFCVIWVLCFFNV